jgi:predicted MFS family arabinose efflux permease
MVIFWLKNPEPSIKQNLGIYLKKAWNNINKKTVWGLFIINILLFVILYGAYLSYFPQLMVERLQATALQIGLMMSAFSVVTATTASQLKRINRIFKPKTQLQIGFILYLISMLILSFANEWWQLAIPIITFGMAHGMIIPGIQTQLVGFAPITERAGFMSINSMVLRIGQTTGPIIIALFYTWGGTGTAFIGGAIVAVIMLLVSIFMVKL